MATKEDRHLLPKISLRKFLEFPAVKHQGYSRIAIALLVLKLMGVVGCFVVFGRVIGLEDRIKVSTMGMALILSFLSLLVGAVAYEQNFLTLAFLLEMYLMSTCIPLLDFALATMRRRAALRDLSITTGSDDSANIAYLVLGFYVFILALVSAWVSLRFRERLQEEAVRAKYECSCAEERQTVEDKMKWTERVLRAVAVVQVIISAIVFALSYQLHSGKWKQLCAIAASSMVCSLLLLMNGTVIRTSRSNKMSRILSIVVFTYMIWDMSKMHPITMDFYQAKQGYDTVCSLQGDCGAGKLYSGLVALLIVDSFVLLFLGFLAMRHSEEMGEHHEDIDDSHDFFGYPKDEAYAVMYMVFSAWVFIYGIVVIIIAFVVNNTGIAKWLGFAIICQCLVAMYGVLSRDRGWLLKTYIITAWSVSTAWWWMSETFDVVNQTDELCKNFKVNCDSNLRVGLGVTSVYIVIGLMMASFSYVLNETLQEAAVVDNRADKPKSLDSSFAVGESEMGSDMVSDSAEVDDDDEEEELESDD